MKKLNILPLLLLFLLASCDAVRVNTDYDKAANFSNYKTYAFYKTGIDKVKISDLDKKRILNSIDAAMIAKGFSKSETPDILININTKAVKNINVNNYGYGVGFGYNPYFGYNMPVSSNVEGVLTIDFIDAAKKELIWQGEGTGYLTQNTNKKDENINNFVVSILEQYPPNKPEVKRVSKNTKKSKIKK